MERQDPINGEYTCQEQLESVVLTTSLSEVHVSANHGAQVPRKSLSFILAFASLMATNFISIMDTVIVATALPAIAHGLNARSNEAYWAGSGFLFAQAVSQPLYGTLSTVFGRKDCLLFAMAIFTVASIFCATAQSMSWLITARVVSRASSRYIKSCQSAEEIETSFKVLDQAVSMPSVVLSLLTWYLFENVANTLESSLLLLRWD